MTNLEDLTARILQRLGDPAAARYPTEQVHEAVRLALSAFSQAWPHVAAAVIELQDGQAQIPLAASCPGLLAVLEVLFPYHLSRPALSGRPRCWHLSLQDGLPVLELAGLRPIAGQQLGCVYSACHSLAGLDGQTQTSFPDGLAGVLLAGAAGHAAAMRAAAVLESYGGRSGDPAALQAQAGTLLEEFRTRLSGLRIAPPGLPGLLPLLGWPLDAYSGA